jgi:hypothetical protein
VGNEDYILYGAGSWDEAEENANKKYRPKQAMVTLAKGFDILNESVPFEPTDEERDILDIYYTLDYLTRELIAESYDHSLREIQNIYDINYGLSHRKIHIGLDLMLGDAKEQLYNNSNMKIRKAKKK